MKKYRKLLFLTALVMAAETALSAFLIFSVKFASADEEKLNDIIMTVQENWYSPDILKETDFGMDVLVLNNDNDVVFTNNPQMAGKIDSVYRAALKGFKCFPVQRGNRSFGTVIIPDEGAVSLQKARYSVVAVQSVMAVLMICTAAAFGLYAEFKILRPFRKLKDYAGLISQGRLDEPLMMDRNNIFGDFTVSFDIMREELKKSQKAENDLKIREKELIASLSHDLKTPVTGIRLLCELLSVKTDDRYVCEKVENISQKAEQIDVLISDMLASALDDLGEMNVSVQDENSEVIRELIKAGDTRNLVTEYTIPECIVLTDRNRLMQVIGNIFSNSYKYAGTAVDVSARINGRFIELCISDHGPGVPDDEIIYVTNKFYRGRSNSTGKEGSGLGLYIASELMGKMGGELICSSDGNGFSVTLYIPLS